MRNSADRRRALDSFPAKLTRYRSSIKYGTLGLLIFERFRPKALWPRSWLAFGDGEHGEWRSRFSGETTSAPASWFFIDSGHKTSNWRMDCDRWVGASLSVTLLGLYRLERGSISSLNDWLSDVVCINDEFESGRQNRLPRWSWWGSARVKAPRFTADCFGFDRNCGGLKTGRRRPE